MGAHLASWLTWAARREILRAEIVDDATVNVKRNHLRAAAAIADHPEAGLMRAIAFPADFITVLM